MSTGEESVAGQGALPQQFRHVVRSQSRKMAVYITITRREICVYLSFLVIFSVALFMSRSDKYSFYYSNLVKDLLIEEEFVEDDAHIRKTFLDVGEIEEFWQWVQGPLVNGLYPDQLYGGATLPSGHQGQMFGVNRRVGAVRLRQVRVKSGTCTVPSSFQSKFRDCYGVFNSGNEETTPMVKGSSRYTYKTAEDLGESFALMGPVETFGAGGYIVDLPNTRNGTLAVIQRLKSEIWVDLQTRAVFVDINLYNPGVNLFLVGRLFVEFPASGGAVPYYVLRVPRLFMYAGMSGKITLALELIVLAFIAYYIWEEVKECVRDHGAYLRDRWNVLDIINLSCFVVVIVLRAVVLIDINNTRFSLTSAEYYNLEEIAWLMDLERNVNAINAFLCYVKIFKYVQNSRFLNQLSRTLIRAGIDLAFFLFMFFVVFFGYALAGFVLFGNDMYEYRSLVQSMTTLFKGILGDFDFESMWRANRYLGPLFFISFQILCFFVLMNMFLAIVNEAYGAVKSRERPQFHVRRAIRRTASNLKSLLKRRKSDVERMKSAVETADEDKNGKISHAELQRALRRGTDTDAGAESRKIMELFDKDKDNQLDEEEQRELASVLRGKQLRLNRIEDQLNVFEEAADVVDGGGVFAQSSPSPPPFLSQATIEDFFDHFQPSPPYSCPTAPVRRPSEPPSSQSHGVFPTQDRRLLPPLHLPSKWSHKTASEPDLS